MLREISSGYFENLYGNVSLLGQPGCQISSSDGVSAGTSSLCAEACSSDGRQNLRRPTRKQGRSNGQNQARGKPASKADHLESGPIRFWRSPGSISAMSAEPCQLTLSIPVIVAIKDERCPYTKFTRQLPLVPFNFLQSCFFTSSNDFNCDCENTPLISTFMCLMIWAVGG